LAAWREEIGGRFRAETLGMARRKVSRNGATLATLGKGWVEIA
jgi:hypothetical protein